MKVIDKINVRHEQSDREIMLCVGDLSRIPEHEAVDVLVVSAFPDDYYPITGTLIGALNEVGVSVAELAGEKEV